MTSVKSSSECEDTTSNCSNTITTESNCSGNDLETETESVTKSLHRHSCSSNCSNSDAINSSNAENKLIKFVDVEDGQCIDNDHRSKPKRCCSFVCFFIGLLLLTAGVLTIIVPIYDFVLTERLNMMPGLPTFELWVIPAPEVKLRVYIFTVENSDAFLNGTDEILRFQEIGPIVYRERLHHKNVEFHKNSTLSYTAARHVEFLDDENEPGILNRTILVPNFVILATAAKMNDDNFLKKIGFMFLLRGSTDSLFMNITVYKYLWEYQSDLVRKVQSFAPFLVPTENSGVLHQIYVDFNDRYNVRIGPKYNGDHFFEITSVNGGSVVPGYHISRGECNASIVGSTEGALYKTHLTEESVLWYWRKTLCRQVPLYFEQRIQKGSFEAYKYVLRENVFDRSDDLEKDCYRGAYDILPNGLSDVSKCFYDMPFAASNPHFYGRYPNEMTKKLAGFNPIKDRHQSFIIVEPTMGVPIDQSARSQSNVIIPQLYGFNEEIERFSNMALPTFWVEYHQKELTPNIEALIYVTLYVLPVLQYCLPIFLILVGCVLVSPVVWSCFLNPNNINRRNSKSKYEKNCKLHESIGWNLK